MRQLGSRCWLGFVILMVVILVGGMLLSTPTVKSDESPLAMDLATTGDLPVARAPLSATSTSTLQVPRPGSELSSPGAPHDAQNMPSSLPSATNAGNVIETHEHKGDFREFSVC